MSDDWNVHVSHEMSPQRPQRCELCVEQGIVRINASWFCDAHIDDGFRLVMRGVAIIRGVDPDRAEHWGVPQFEHLRRRFGEV